MNAPVCKISRFVMKSIAADKRGIKALSLENSQFIIEEGAYQCCYVTLTHSALQHTYISYFLLLSLSKVETVNNTFLQGYAN